MPNPRKPKRLKEVEGTDRADRDYGEVELPEPDNFDPPDWLNGPEAVDEWTRLTSLLFDAGILTAGDLSALAHLCNLHGRCARLWHAGESPTAAELTQLRLGYKEFCLTPASRSAAPNTRGKDGDNDPAERHFSGPRAVNE